MRIGINDGTLNDGTLDRVIENARTAEAQGFASYWVSQIFGHDAMTTLAVVGREVPRIELGIAVVPTYPRHPMQMAGGSLFLALGTQLTRETNHIAEVPTDLNNIFSPKPNPN